jgi:ParB-like chromosome segregation protein Spo0J
LAIAANLEHDLPHLKLKDIEEAKAMQRLIREHKWSQESIGDFLGKSQRWVSYRLSMLKAPEEVQKRVEEGELKEGHVRHITQLPESVQSKVADKVVAEGLTSRQTEQLVSSIKTHPEPANITPEEMDAMLARNHEEINKSMPIGQALQDAGAVRLHKDTKGIYFFTNTCPACGNEHNININFDEGFALLTRPKDLAKKTLPGGRAS